MAEDITKLNLYQKMIKITEELGKIGKNLEVKGADGRVRYTAVGETDVLDTVKPLETRYHIYSYPLLRNYIDLHLANKVALRVETIYRFVNADNPDEYIDITSYGDGIDSGDKAPGKAMTYSDKYALMKAYKISTGDDPDQEMSPEPKLSKAQSTLLKDLLKGHDSLHLKMLATYNVSKIDNLTRSQAIEAIDRVKKNIEIREQEANKVVETSTQEVKPQEVETETTVETETKTEVVEESVKEEPVKEEASAKNTPVKEEVVEEKVELATAQQKAKILAKMSEERRAKMLKAYKKSSLEELTKAEANAVLERLQKEDKK